MEGRFDVAPPKGWAALSKQMKDLSKREQEIFQSITQQFGDSETAKQMIALLKNPKGSIEERRKAIQILAGQKRDELKTRVAEFDGAERTAARCHSSFEFV